MQALKIKKTMQLILGLLIITQFAFSQTREITGRVTVSESGKELVGVQVFVKDSFIGTTTDSEGYFKLDVPEGNVKLIAAYIGYRTNEITVPAGASEVNISMETDVLKGDQVVVTGLASSVKRRNLSNAVATVSGEELINAPTQTLDAALSGKFAGVNIRRNTGAPGGGINVNLRGASTLTGSTQPLYVIDGIIVNNNANQSGIDVVTAAAGAGSASPQGQPTNRIGDINPNDIASIEVLKGASAAAMYGAKASNGVIIIKTKQGQGGKTVFSFTQRIGQSKLVNKMGHRVFKNYAEAEEQYGSAIADLGNNASGSWANRDIDYEQETYGETGILKESVISAAGGNQNTQFYFGGQYLDEGGIIKNTGYKKLSGRLNMKHRFNDKTRVSLTTSLSRTESDRGVTGNDNSGLTYGFAIGFTPSFIDIRDTDGDGDFPVHPLNAANYLETIEYFVNNELVHGVKGSLQLEHNIFGNSSQSLDFVGVAGVDFYNQENRIFSPPFTQFERDKTNAGQSIMRFTDNLNSNLYLNLVHKLNMSGMSLLTTGGIQFETQDWNSVYVHSEGMIPTQTNVDKASTQAVYHDRALQQDRGIFLQGEVTLGDNIYLSAGARGDKSSTLGITDEYNWYPKLSASYQFGKIAGIFDNLKLRVATGQTGNMPTNSAKYTTMSSSNIGGINGLLPVDRKGQAGIVPERTTEIEFGTDFSVMDGLASVEATYYTQAIEDLVLEVDLPGSSGSVTQWENGGEMETKGYELSFTVNPTKLYSVGGLNWISRINYHHTESEVTKLTVDPYNTGGFATFLGTYRIEEGYSPTAIVGSEMTADGKHEILGDETPDYNLSWFNQFQLGPLDFSFLFEKKAGGHAINLANLIYDLGATTVDYVENGTTRLDGLGTITAPYVESTEYTVWREINLNYTLPSSITDTWGLTYLKLGIQARNLGLKTDYSGLSPEVSQFGNVAVGGSVDTNPYPLSASTYFTISLGF